jgi:methyl-accepting chemotaxis protein
MRKSIKAKLMVMMVLLVTIPLVVLGGLSYSRSAKVVHTSFKGLNGEIVREVASGIRNYMDTFEIIVDVFARSQTATTVYEYPASKDMLLKEFQTFMDGNEDVMFVYMGTEDKDMFDPSWEDIPEDWDPTIRPWYTLAKEAQGTVWTPPYVDDDSGKPVISVAAPVYNSQDQFIGVVGMDISLESLVSEINNVKIGETGYLILISDQNKVLAHKNLDLLDTEVSVKEIADAISSQDNGTVDYSYNGVDRFAVFHKLEGLNWTALVTLDKGEVDQQTQPILYTTLYLIIACMVVGALAAALQAKSLVKPIMQLEATMEQVTRGDLTVRSEVDAEDEIGAMAKNFNTMIEHFAGMLGKSKHVAQQVFVSAEDLAASSEEVSASSDEVARTVDEIAQGAGEQASETEKGAKLIADLAEKLQVLTEDSRNMSTAAQSVSEANVRGTQVMDDLRVKTTDNNAATVRIADAVKELEKKSFEIGGILATITSIADQTNLLALNASIEAARAGEHGRGFAVVAEEIRKLAEGSSEAADTIKTIVFEIQEESKHTVAVMTEVQSRTQEQGMAVTSVNEVFEEIHMATEKISDIIGEVSKFIDGVNHDKDQIVDLMGNISAVSEEAAAASEEVTASVQQQTSAIEEVARAAEMLNVMADELKKEIDTFRL